MDLTRLRSVPVEAGTCQTKGLTRKEQKHQQLAHLALRGSNEESFLISSPNLQQMWNYFVQSVQKCTVYRKEFVVQLNRWPKGPSF